MDGFQDRAPMLPSDGMPKMPATINTVWFVAGVCTASCALLAGLSEFFSWQLLDFIEACYLLIFGAVLAALDAPEPLRNLQGTRELVYLVTKYCNLLMRVTGKGLVFVWIGTSLWSSLWTNVNNGFLLFLAGVLSFFVVIVGLVSTAVGVRKSLDLDKVRQALQNNANGKLDNAFHNNAHNKDYLTKQEFRQLINDVNGGVDPAEQDFDLYLNALSTSVKKDTIRRGDLLDWANGSIVLL